MISILGIARLIRAGTMKVLTVILAVSPDPETSCFDCGETEPDGLTQGGGVDVRNTVLVADTTIGKVESLAGDVSVGVRSVVGGEPRHKRALISETIRSV